MAELESKNPPIILQADVCSLIQKFLESHDIKPISRESYGRRLKQFFLWCMEEKVHQPNRDTILKYKRFLDGKQASPLTVAAYLTSIRCFFSWAESVKIYPNIARSIKGPKKQKGFRRDPLTVPQVLELLASIETKTLKGKRDFALLNLLIRTGPRSVEITRANVEDIRQESGETVLWLQGKGSDTKDAFVVLTKETLVPIQEYLFARGVIQNGAPLFGSTSDGNRGQRMGTRSIRRIVKERFRGIKLDSPRLSTHSCRHTAVTLALLAGASIQETQQLARHSDVNTTMIYAQNIKRATGVPEKKIAEILSSH